MKKESGRIGSLWPFLIIMILLAALVAVGIKYKNLNPDMRAVMGLMTKKLEILSRMRVNLLKSVEAEKMAVMADTDKSSGTTPMNHKRRPNYWKRIAGNWAG